MGLPGQRQRPREILALLGENEGEMLLGAPHLGSVRDHLLQHLPSPTDVAVVQVEAREEQTRTGVEYPGRLGLFEGASGFRELSLGSIDGEEHVDRAGQRRRGFEGAQHVGFGLVVGTLLLEQPGAQQQCAGRRVAFLHQFVEPCQRAGGGRRAHLELGERLQYVVVGRLVLVGALQVGVGAPWVTLALVLRVGERCAPGGTGRVQDLLEQRPAALPVARRVERPGMHQLLLRRECLAADPKQAVGVEQPVPILCRSRDTCLEAQRDGRGWRRAHQCLVDGAARPVEVPGSQLGERQQPEQLGGRVLFGQLAELG